MHRLRYTFYVACLGLSPLLHAAECAMQRPIQVKFYDLGVIYDPTTGKGLDVDIVDELERRTGCHFTHGYDSRVRIWDQMRQGSLDMTLSGAATPERERFARFIVEISGHEQLLTQNTPGFPATAQAFLDDPRLLAGSVNSYQHSPLVSAWFDQLQARGRVYYAPDQETLYRLLDAGRIAAIPVLTPSLGAEGGRYPLTHPVVRRDWFANDSRIKGGIALSRKRLTPGFGDQIEAAFNAMVRDGTYRRILARYFAPSEVDDVLSDLRAPPQP